MKLVAQGIQKLWHKHEIDIDLEIDFDLDPMTLIHELNLDIMKI